MISKFSLIIFSVVAGASLQGMSQKGGVKVLPLSSVLRKINPLERTKSLEFKETELDKGMVATVITLTNKKSSPRGNSPRTADTRPRTSSLSIVESEVVPDAPVDSTQQ